MKRVISLLFLLFLLISVESVYAEEKTEIYINAKILETSEEPVIIDGRTLIPVRDIFESLGAKVEWDEKTKTVLMTGDNVEIKMKIGATKFWRNNIEMNLDVPPCIVNDRTMLPIRAVGESLSADVTWDDKRKRVIIVTDDFKRSLIHRSVLSDELLKAYDILWVSFSKAEEGLIEDCQVVREDLNLVFNSVLYDHPEILRLENDYRYLYNSNSNVITSVQPNYLDFDIEEYKKFDEIIKPLIDEAQNKQTEYEKIKYVHDWIVDYLSYSTDVKESQNAVEAILNKKSVCAGYSRLFQYCMHELQIPCAYITGTLNGVPHGWNLIKFNNQYYNVDVTNDDNYYEKYRYFLCSDSKLNQNGYKKSEYFNLLPKCEKNW